MSTSSKPTPKDLLCVINYLNWKSRQLANLTKMGRLDAMTCLKLKTDVSSTTSLVHEDLDHLLIKGYLYE
jgi:hypothetical protein